MKARNANPPRKTIRIAAAIYLLICLTEVTASAAEARLGASFYRYSERSAEALVTVVRESASSGEVVVGYATEDVTAKAGADYVAARGTLTFAPGQSRKRIRVALAPDDFDVEPNKTFRVILDTAGGANGASAFATVQIDDDDTALICPEEERTIIAPPDGAFKLRVVRERGLDREVSVHFQVRERWTTPQGDESQERSGRLVFAPGQTERAVEGLAPSQTVRGEVSLRLDDPRGDASLVAATTTLAVTGPPLREIDLSLGTLDVIVPSPDGTLVLTAGNEGGLVWESSSGKLLQRLPMPGPGVPWSYENMDQKVFATWSRDQKLLAISTGRSIYLWDVGSGDLIKRMVSANNWEQANRRPSVAFSPDGKVVAHGVLGGIEIWNVEKSGDLDLDPERVLGAPWGREVALSPDGQRAVAFGSGGVGIWDVHSGKVTGVIGSRNSQLAGPGFSSFSGDGQSVVIRNASRVEVWDLKANRLVLQLPAVESPSLSFAGDRLAGLASGHELQVWDTRTEERLLSVPLESYGSLAISPDGSQVLIRVSATAPEGFRFFKLVLYDVATGTLHWIIDKVLGGIPLIAPDGTKAVVVAEGNLQAYDLTDGGLIFQSTFPSGAAPQIGGFSPDSSKFLLQSHALCVFDLDDRILERTFENEIWPSAIGWADDGAAIVKIAYDSGHVDFLNPISGENVLEVPLSLDGYVSQASMLAFSSSGQEILAVDGKIYWLASDSTRKARVLDLVTGEVLSELAADRCWVGEDRIVTAEARGGEASVLTVRDALSSDILHESSYPGMIRNVSLTADGQHLALSHYLANDGDAGTESLLVDLSTHAELWRHVETGWRARAVVGIMPDASGILLAHSPCERNGAGWLPQIWDPAEDKVGAVFVGHGIGMERLEVIRSGQGALVSYLSQSCYDDSTRGGTVLWNLETGEPMHVFEEIDGYWLSKDGRRMLTLTYPFSDEFSWTVWNLEIPEPVHTTDLSFLMESGARLDSPDLSPDGRFVLGRLRRDGVVEAVVWEAETGQELARTTLEINDFVEGFAPDGQDGQVILRVDLRLELWDLNSNARRVIGDSPNGPGVIVSPDGTRALTVYPKALWNVQTAERLWGLDALQSSSRVGVFSPDSQWLAIDVGSSIVLLNSANGREQWRADGGGGGWAFSPDNKWLLIPRFHDVEVRAVESGVLALRIATPTFLRFAGFLSPDRFWAWNETGMLTLNQITSLHFSPVRVQSDGGIQFLLSGTGGQLVRLQRSNNLLDWEDWKTVELEEGRDELSDSVASGEKHFYRAIQDRAMSADQP